MRLRLERRLRQEATSHWDYSHTQTVLSRPLDPCHSPSLWMCVCCSCVCLRIHGLRMWMWDISVSIPNSPSAHVCVFVCLCVSVLVAAVCASVPKTRPLGSLQPRSSLTETKLLFPMTLQPFLNKHFSIQPSGTIVSHSQHRGGEGGGRGERGRALLRANHILAPNHLLETHI